MSDYSDTFSSVAAGRAGKAANAASANLDASILAIQMIKEMRDWEAGRFNDVIDSLIKRKEENQTIMNEIQDLKAQVAGLQKRLYEEQNKTPLKAVAR